MAEIKSTMDLVMERAARIGKASSEELRQSEARTRGMHLTVDYLDGKSSRLLEELEREDAAVQMAIRQGMVESLLRNIFLARDDVQLERVTRASQGLVELSGNARDVASICQELRHIIDGYARHREQLRRQLEDQVRVQYEQALARQMGEQAGELNIDPALQPKFKEEWSRIEAELDSQYMQALEQHKTTLKQRLRA